MESVIKVKRKKTSILMKIFIGFCLIIGLLIIFLIGSFINELVASSKVEENYPVPGTLVEAGGSKLHVLKQGSGSPTIVFESGQGATSMYWRKVVSQLPSNVTVVTYDRAGYGWSEKHVSKRTGENIAKELHTALENAQIGGPYIFVAHSIGGMYSRIFAKEYKGEMFGMMFLDSPSENFLKQIDKIIKNAGFDPKSFGTAPTGTLKFLKTSGLLRVFKGPILGSYYDTEKEINEAVNITMTPQYYDAIKAETLEEPKLAKALQNQTLGDIPITVISKGKAEDFTELGLSEKDNKTLQELWNKEQKWLATLSTDSEILVAENSGHNIPIDEPDLVITEINKLIKRVQNKNSHKH
ncbi:alpha/beta fold hydrolase [Bacillus sp. CGMCC 1.16607]|uniref:alpha/beta fold hydrolase n=1 Tax=Bacillus sp. CGMCC 1.16607 TaxID=3351842 RepID=UPI00362EA23F